MAPLVSLVIRCYNEAEHIGRLLTGIQRQSLRDLEIIIVDSGSTDDTLRVAARYPTKVLTIPKAEFSFGRSLNLGCQEAKGEFIVIASAHVYPLYNDWLVTLLAPFVDPQVALSYGRQHGNHITKYAEHRVFARWFPEQSNADQGHAFCNNANAAIRRSLWQELPYDETLTGLEDIDWAKRALQKQYKIAYAAEAEVIHVHNESPMRIYNRYQREAIALKRIYPQEHFSFWDFAKLFLTNTGVDYYHAWCERAFGPNLWWIPLFRLMQFWGTFRGFAQSGPITSHLKQRFYYPATSVPSRASLPIKNAERYIFYEHDTDFA